MIFKLEQLENFNYVNYFVVVNILMELWKTAESSLSLSLSLSLFFWVGNPGTVKN